MWKITGLDGLPGAQMETSKGRKNVQITARWTSVIKASPKQLKAT